MPKKPLKSKTRQKPDTAAELIRSFLALSARQGVARLTLQQVAKHAGISFATAHHHFGGGKLDLREEVSRTVGVEAQRFISEWVERAALEGENPLRAYFIGSFRWAELHPESAGFWIYHYHVLSFHPEKRADHAKVVEVAQSRIHRLLLEAIGSGIYPSSSAEGKRGKVTCANLHSLLIGGMILAITDPAPGAYVVHATRAWAGVEAWLISPAS